MTKYLLSKRFVVIVCVTVGAVFLYLYRDVLLYWLTALEHLRTTMPYTTALILIVLKGIAGPLGFPGTPLTLLTGSLFGAFIGTGIALVGNTLGAVLAFLLARYIAGSYVRDTFGVRYPKLAPYIRRLEESPFGTICLLRLIPLVPFNALNFILGLTSVPLRTYMYASAVGMLPGTFAFVYLGESLRLFDPLNILFAVIGIIALIYFGSQYGNRAYTE